MANDPLDMFRKHTPNVPTEADKLEAVLPGQVQAIEQVKLETHFQLPLPADSVVVVDLETTGTKWRVHEILEVGMIVYDAKLEVEIASYQSTVFYFPSDVLRIFRECDPIVQQMHTDNGLWIDLAKPGLGKTLEQIGREISQWIKYLFGEVKPIIAGNNVESFDRMFLQHWIPEAEQAFHYRSIPISGLREVCRRELGVELENKGEVKHRALDDCRSSAKLYRTCVNLLRGVNAI